MSRPVRDILAECLRRERLGLIRPLWHDLSEESREERRQRADHLIRLLAKEGVEIALTGQPHDHAVPSDIIQDYALVGKQARRRIRVTSDRIEIIASENGRETVELTFSQIDGLNAIGLVLTDDPAAKTVPALGRVLAAFAWAAFVHAVGAPAERMEVAE